MVGRLALFVERQQKINGDHLRALVQQLKKGMLGAGPGGAPDDGAGVGLDRRAMHIRGLAVTLHKELRQKVRQVAQRFIVGNKGVGPGAKIVAVPVIDQGQHDRRIGL